MDLDDSFFRSRPYAYFSSRIASLIDGRRPGESEPADGLAARFSALLGPSSQAELLAFDKSDRELQIATDAFALRHHAAESLVRLYHALTHGTADPHGAKCVWAAITEGPVRTVDLVDQAREHLSSSEGSANFWKLIFPEAITGRADLHEQANQALNVLADWLEHAAGLLVRNDVNVNAAHNKVKHGLAIRARDDIA